MSDSSRPDGVVRAAVITGPRSAALRTLPRPVPGAGEVAIRVEGCGLCGSNLPLWEGRPWFGYPTPPGSPGHEGWGRVSATGPGVTAVAEGDRVAFLSDRALADQIVTDAGALVRIPASLDGADVPGEPLGCAMNVWRRSDIRAEHTVAVIGVGFFGALLTQLAARAGARVIAISRRRYSLELARRMGAAHTVALDDDARVTTEVLDLTRGHGCDRTIEAVGAQRTLDLASALCRTRGRMILVGFHQDGSRQVDVQMWNWRGLDVINAHERDPAVYLDGMRAAIDALVSGRLDVAPLLTHRVPLAEVGRALELLRTRPDGFVKALVIP